MRLADHLAEMVEGDTLIVLAETAVDEEDGAAPYVQFCAWGGGHVRCEAVSNDFLAREYHLDDVGTLALLELGYGAPHDGCSGSPNFFVDLRTTEADRAAVMAVRALRDVFGVPHPAFLSSDELAPDDEEDHDLPTVEEPPETDEPVARYPHGGAEELQQFVDEALTSYFGHPVEHDEDGDIPVRTGSSMLFVGVLTDVPVVRLFSCVVGGVKDREQAALEVGLLNRDSGPVKFVLDGLRILATLDLPAWPFAPEHLRTAVAAMSQLLDDIDDDLALRVSGSRAFEPAVDDDVEDATPQPLLPGEELHPALATIHELEVSRPGSVDPRLVASICHMDGALILSFIRHETSQVDACSDALACSEDPEEEGECERELQRAARSVALLRRALRVVVDAEAGRASEEPDLWSDARAVGPKKKTPPKTRKAPDPTLEEVDPEMWRPDW
jgi:hypothetical protein